MSDTCTPINAALFTTANMEKTQVPLTDEWINKMWSVCVYIHTPWNSFQPLKKNIPPLATMWMTSNGPYAK